MANDDELFCAGFIQTFNWTEDLYSHGHWGDTLEMDVPLGHSVMLSIAQKDLGVSEISWYARAGHHYHRKWIVKPVVIKTTKIKLDCEFGTRGTFRILFTFHNVLELDFLCVFADS